MQPLEKLLLRLKREGIRLPPWMMPLGNEVITYDGVRYAHKAFIEKLRKDAGDDLDDEDDEEDGESGSEEDEESGGDEDGENKDDDSDFNSKHPRWPAGSPDGTGGEFAPKEDSAAASQTQVAQEVLPFLFEQNPAMVRPSIGEFPQDVTQPPGPGWEWKGQPGSQPGDPDGSWTNPTTGERLYPDMNHQEPQGPHWDYRAPDKTWYRWFPDGTIEPKVISSVEIA